MGTTTKAVNKDHHLSILRCMITGEYGMPHMQKIGRKKEWRQNRTPNRSDADAAQSSEQVCLASITAVYHTATATRQPLAVIAPRRKHEEDRKTPRHEVKSAATRSGQ